MHEQFERIQRDLDTVEREENVKVLLAVESGSRAWGFPSSDSDYDVRFIYCHPQDKYLTIEPFRDVIERPIIDEIDLAGWDIRKALRLFRKSNPPLLEWLSCNIIYHEYTSFAMTLRAMTPMSFSRRSSFYHYLSMGSGNLKDSLQGEHVRYKKYFYVLRPVLACNWLEQGHGAVPISFGELLEAILPHGEVRAAVDALLVLKQYAPELMEGPVIPSIHMYLESEITRLHTVAAQLPPHIPDIGPLNDLFRTTLGDAWKG